MKHVILIIVLAVLKESYPLNPEILKYDGYMKDFEGTGRQLKQEKNKEMNPSIVKREDQNRVASTIAGTHEEKLSKEESIFEFNKNNPNYYVTRSLNTVPSTRRPNPDFQYRLAITEIIELFKSQRAQINFTIEHFNNVWGTEDKAVIETTRKLNSLKSFIELEMNALIAKMERDIAPQERSNMPLNWSTIDVMRTAWKEVEEVVDKKIEKKPLTKAEEDELYQFREWLKFSDQELAIPFDAMKEKMEKVFAADQSAKEYSSNPPPTVIRPISPRY